MARGERTENHPNRRVDIEAAYALLQGAHQDMSPSAHAMHEQEAMFDSRYISTARDMANNPETIKNRVTLAKGGLVL